jgi:WGR domain-containing protein
MSKAQQHDDTPPQKELCLFRIDPDQNMHRNYCMALHKDLFGGTNLVREWGRISRGGQVQISNHLSMYGCIWTPPNCNGLFGSGFEVAIADVYPASLGGPIYRSREPRWISACFPLIAPKASIVTLPIHTSGSRSNGCDPFPSPGRCCNIPELALLMSAFRYGFQLNDTS